MSFFGLKVCFLKLNVFSSCTEQIIFKIKSCMCDAAGSAQIARGSEGEVREG